jgi:hypothetical protein
MMPGAKKEKLPALDPTRDPQKPGAPTSPRDSRTPPPSTLPDSPPTKGSVPSDPDDKGRRDEDGL